MVTAHWVPRAMGLPTHSKQGTAALHNRSPVVGLSHHLHLSTSHSATHSQLQGAMCQACLNMEPQEVLFQGASMELCQSVRQQGCYCQGSSQARSAHGEAQVGEHSRGGTTTAPHTITQLPTQTATQTRQHPCCMAGSHSHSSTRRSCSHMDKRACKHTRRHRSGTTVLLLYSSHSSMAVQCKGLAVPWQ